MQCPDCGYMLTAFDKVCPRCILYANKPKSSLGVAFTPPSSAKIKTNTAFLFVGGGAMLAAIIAVAYFTFSPASETPDAHVHTKSVVKPTQLARVTPPFSSANLRTRSMPVQTVFPAPLPPAPLPSDEATRKNQRQAQENVYQENFIREQVKREENRRQFDDLQSRVNEFNSLYIKVVKARFRIYQSLNGYDLTRSSGRKDYFSRTTDSGLPDGELERITQRVIELHLEIVQNPLTRGNYEECGLYFRQSDSDDEINHYRVFRRIR